MRELLRKFAQVHILAVPKLWFWANFAWFEGSGALLRITSFAVCVINAGLLWRLLSPADKPVRCCCLPVFALFFNGFQTLALDWDFLLPALLCHSVHLAGISTVVVIAGDQSAASVAGVCVSGTGGFFMWLRTGFGAGRRFYVLYTTGSTCMAHGVPGFCGGCFVGVMA